MTQYTKCNSRFSPTGNNKFFRCQLDEEHGGQHEFLIVWNTEDEAK